MLQGRKLTFDEESQALYDAVAPTHADRRSSIGTLAQLEAAAAGRGPAARSL